MGPRQCDPVDPISVLLPERLPPRAPRVELACRCFLEEPAASFLLALAKDAADESPAKVVRHEADRVGRGGDALVDIALDVAVTHPCRLKMPPGKGSASDSGSASPFDCPGGLPPRRPCMRLATPTRRSTWLDISISSVRKAWSSCSWALCCSSIAASRLAIFRRPRTPSQSMWKSCVQPGADVK